MKLAAYGSHPTAQAERSEREGDGGQKEEFKQTLNSESVRAPALYKGDGQTEKKVTRLNRSAHQHR